MISSTGYPIFVAKIFAVVLARLAGDEIIQATELSLSINRPAITGASSNPLFASGRSKSLSLGSSREDFAWRRR